MVLGRASVFHALVFRVALVRVGRRASGVETARKGALILWIASTKTFFERGDSIKVDSKT